MRGSTTPENALRPAAAEKRDHAQATDQHRHTRLGDDCEGDEGTTARSCGIAPIIEPLGVSTHKLRAALLLLETEGRVALSEDGRSRHVTAKGTADKHQLRIGILLYGPLDEDSPHTIHFMISLHHALEGEGFLPFFPPRTKPRCAGMSDGFVIT